MMKKNLLFALALLLVKTEVSAANVQIDSLPIPSTKQTLLYSIKGADSLYLDLYQVDSLHQSKGCVIFAFGGGFLAGTRDDKFYLPFFEYLRSNDYTVVSIDYRLGLKNVGNKVSPMGFIKAIEKSVYMAAEDMLDATKFVLDHALEYDIDPQKIIVSGSSAGAITSLQAEYEICNRTVYAADLPEDFNYAGLISFAGAVISVRKKPQWNTPPCPMLLFHGDADTFVPFDNVGALGYKMYGSNYIVPQIKKLNSPYYFYYMENADHFRMASDAVHINHKEVMRFLDEWVQEGRRMQLTEKIEDMDLPEKPDHYSLLDYFKTMVVYL